MNSDEDRKALITYRLKQAQEALEDAKKLVKHQGSPRSIANRSYYAMFYAVLALLLVIGKGTSKHSGAIALFDQYFVKTGLLPKELSRSLHRAFELRQQGDYEELAEIGQEDGLEAIKNAEKFLGSVHTYLRKEGIN
ncbi:MAG: HEPN domain-containing protein [Firmicutes bacterium]|nr:HEPN domain-containing protein [Bacillota bacterium]